VLLRPNSLEPIPALDVIRREKIVVLHVVLRRLVNLQATWEAAEESAQSDIHFAVCEPE
jgi:hypothetical protein